MHYISEADAADFKVYRDTLDLTNFPRTFRLWYENASEPERTKWFEMRFRCLKDPVFLGGFVKAETPGDEQTPGIEDYMPILGMDFQPTPHTVLFRQFLQFKPGKRLVLSDLDTAHKKRMILWPRGLFKTSGIIVFIVQAILNYPNIRICFMTGSNPLAKGQLRRIKTLFEKPTKTFAWLWPEYCTKDIRNKRVDDENATNAWLNVPAKLGTANEFTVPCRTTHTFAEPTFAISTARSVKAGSHFDLILIDDLVNEQNYKNVKMLEKCFQDYLDICPLLDPSGFMILTGTRYSFGDTYERIQDLAKEEERKMGKTIWKFSIRTCWDQQCTCGHGDVWHNREERILEPPCTHEGCNCISFRDTGVKGVLFPQFRGHDGREHGHTVEWLEAERIRITPEFFANQYENQPIATGQQTFTEALVGARTLHDEKAIPTYLQAATIAVGDLAYVGQEGRDFSVVYIMRVFMGQLFLYHCLYGNWDSDKIANVTAELLLVHRVQKVFYERFNGWEAYQNVILAKCKQKGIDNVPLEWLKVSQTPNAKLVRIGAVKGPLEAGRLWFFADMPGYQDMTNQLVKWPKLGKHDDFADGVGLCVEAPTGYQFEAPPQPPPPMHWLRKLNQTAEVSDGYYDNGAGSGVCC